MQELTETVALTNHRRVLVVDDDPATRLVARQALESDGFDVLEAADGWRARCLLTATEVDAVITEIYMPELDGLELISWMKRTVPGIPVVAMSAGGRHGDLLSLHVARALGAQGVLQKPFGATVMLEVMRHLFATCRSVSPGSA